MCNCNCNTIKITEITTTGTGVVLIPARTIINTNLMNTGKYKLIIACGLKSTNSLPVFIQTQNGNIPVLCKFANPVYSNQLKTRRAYCIGFGNRNTTPYPLGQFVIFDDLCCACSTGTTTTVAMTSSTSTKKEDK